MKHPVLPSVEEVWRERCRGLVDALGETIDQLHELLRLDEYHRHGHDPEQLENALGPMARANLDVGALSRVLEGSTRSRAMTPERRRRVEGLVPVLTELKEAWSRTPLDDALIELGASIEEIRALASAYFDRLANVFRAERIAQLEIHSKYDAEVHDAAFADFDWSALGPGELRLCPPFLVSANLAAEPETRLFEMMSLLGSGMPLKLLAFRSDFEAHERRGSGARVPARMTVETLPLAMRGVYFLQTTTAAQNFRDALLAALASPRPGLVSLLVSREDESRDAFHNRSERAVRARAFPMCVYDPDRDARFVNCFDLAGNPAPDAPWVIETHRDQDSEGQPIEVQEPFTPAHFAVSEPELSATIAEAPANPGVSVPLAEFLALSRQQRVGKAPVISVPISDGSITHRIVGPALMQWCEERLHLWRMLQEISGVENPHVHAARSALRRELAVERDAQLEGLQREMEQAAVQREQTAVANAVQRLVARLLGTTVSS